MLAKTYLTAKELNISEGHRDALFKVLDILEGDSIHYTVDVLPVDKLKDLPTGYEHYFNMAFWKEPHDCGTVACIGGMAEIVSGLDFKFTHDHNIMYLFYPNVGYKYNKITPKEGAQALKNYLETGFPRWKEVLELKLGIGE